MIKSLLFIAIALFSSLFALDTPSGARKIKAPSGKTYLLIPADKSMNHADAVKACSASGGKLADLGTSEDIKFVGAEIKSESWINSFMGQKSTQCMAVFGGGAIAEPLSSCSAMLGVVCE